MKLSLRHSHNHSEKKTSRRVMVIAIALCLVVIVLFTPLRRCVYDLLFIEPADNLSVAPFMDVPWLATRPDLTEVRGRPAEKGDYFYAYQDRELWGRRVAETYWFMYRRLYMYWCEFDTSGTSREEMEALTAQIRRAVLASLQNPVIYDTGDWPGELIWDEHTLVRIKAGSVSRVSVTIYDRKSEHNEAMVLVAEAFAASKIPVEQSP